ncbi:MAG: hypothetical protein FJ335_05210 [Sphingomonadales bacterium]|nr:hypothetical protein [Sphingomonadales bacterium]
MAAPSHPVPRLLDLCQRDGISIPTLERVIGRGRGYLARRLDGSTYLLNIRRDEREILAGFFGVPIAELGG